MTGLGVAVWTSGDRVMQVGATLLNSFIGLLAFAYVFILLSYVRKRAVV